MAAEHGRRDGEHQPEFRSRNNLDWIGPTCAMTLAAAAGIVRWTVMAITADVGGIALVEPLHGLSFALLQGCCRDATMVTASRPAIASASLGASPSIRGLLRLREFRLVLTIAALVLGSHALHDSFAMIRWKAAGISPPTVFAAPSFPMAMIRRRPIRPSWLWVAGRRR
jgi:hypothetical protein